MKVFLGGTRGSFPVSGAEHQRYGGDTFCLLVEDKDGVQVLVDAGSGIRRLLDRLRPGSVLFFTHTHLDHLIGMPWLEPVCPSQMISPRGGLWKILDCVFSPPVWPVRLPDCDCPEPDSPLEVGGLRVSWRPVAHPDGCFAYRLDEPATGAAVVVATDTEWKVMRPEARAKFVEFARGADLMIFDAQYRPSEYEEHRGWGHSTWEDAVEAARSASVKKLWLMHHAPDRTDSELDEMNKAVSSVFGAACFPDLDHRMEVLGE